MNAHGYTLVELMLMVAIVGILSSIAIPKTAETIRRAQEARTKANLAVLRESIGAYVSNTGGLFPGRLEDLTTGILPVLGSIPMKATPTYHPDGNSVTNGPRATMTDARGDWYYFNNPAEPEYGTVVVNCIHSDLKGVQWSQY